MDVSLILFMPLLPLAATLVVLRRSLAGQRRCAWIAFGAFVLAFVIATAALGLVTMHGTWTVRLYEPGTAASWVLPLGVHVDRLGGVMLVLIAGLGTLIFRYSLSFMYLDPGYGRFLALLGLTTSTLLGLIVSSNLLMLFACWQLLSCLLPLLAHNLGHVPTRRSAVTTFWWLRAGDAVFLLGIAIAYALYGTLEFDVLFARAAEDPGVIRIWPGVDVAGPTAVTGLLLIGAMTKSAQFPLHVWLLRSLYAPTPVSALLHAGIVNGAGYLINRLAPLYGQSPLTLHAAFVIGALTAVFGAGAMLVQTDVKKTLAFSTIGQMGYMLMECGLGAFSLALFHLIAHGLFKATLFLNCGNVIHEARLDPATPVVGRDDDVGRMSRLTLVAGVAGTLLLPAIILLVAHGAFRFPLLASQGEAMFLFFIWVTSSQAILTLSRLRVVASWNVAVMMLAAMVAVMATYLVGAARFSEFLYPDREVRESFFAAAAIGRPLFDAVVMLAAAAIVLGWMVMYVRSGAEELRSWPWIRRLGSQLYVLLLNEVYVERMWAGRGRRVHWAGREVGGEAAGDRSARRRVIRAGRHVAFGMLLGGWAVVGLVPFGIFTGLIGILLTGTDAVLRSAVLAVVAWGALSGLLCEYALRVIGHRVRVQL